MILNSVTKVWVILVQLICVPGDFESTSRMGTVPGLGIGFPRTEMLENTGQKGGDKMAALTIDVEASATPPSLPNALKVFSPRPWHPRRCKAPHRVSTPSFIVASKPYCHISM